jgi:Tfp pilus assembly PilM family ATPase
MYKGIIAVLEITQTHVKLVIARRDPRGNVVISLKIRQISDTSNQAVSRTLEKLILDSKIKTQSFICIIPRNLAIVRNLRLPSQDPVEVENMLDFQIREHIPYSKEDIITDYLMVRKDAQGYSDVLLATVHRSVLERYINILDSIDITPDIFSLSSLGISKWYGLYLANLNKVSKEVSLLVNIDSKVTDLCFCHGRNLVYSRSITFGLDDINNEKIEGFIEQLHLTLIAYRKQKFYPDISKIILITQSKKIETLIQKLKSEFSIPIEIVNPLENIIRSKRLSISNLADLKETSFTAILGFALGQTQEELNLLPEEIRKKQRAKSVKNELIVSGSFLLLAIFLAIASVWINIYKKEQYIKQLDTILKDIDPQVKAVEVTTKKLELIKEYLTTTTGSGIDIIYELYNILPTSMSLNVFNLDDKGNLTLQGVSTQMSDIFSFQSNLEKSDNFKNVEVKYASKRKTRKGELTDFRIICQVNRE